MNNVEINSPLALQLFLSKDEEDHLSMLAPAEKATFAIFLQNINDQLSLNSADSRASLQENITGIKNWFIEKKIDPKFFKKTEKYLKIFLNHSIIETEKMAPRLAFRCDQMLKVLN